MARSQKHDRKPRELTKAGAKALAAAGALAAGTQAYATPVRFENPGNQWDWGLGPQGPSPGSPFLDRQFLDITLPADQQVGAAYPYASPGWAYSASYSSFRQEIYYDFTFNYVTSIYTYGGILINDSTLFAQALPAGTQIGGSGQSFYSLAFIAQDYYGFHSDIPEGVQTYLGATIKINYQTHYGWIGVVRNGFELDTFAWGYETDPGVPVGAGVPEPNTLALLALGFVAAGAARRRA